MWILFLKRSFIIFLQCYKFLDVENQLEEYHRVYHSSMRIIHECVTNFTKRLGEQFDKAIAREDARETYLNSQKVNNEESTVEANEAAQVDFNQTSDDVQFEENGGIDEDFDQLSDSEYEPVERKSEKSNFRLKYKGKKYQTGQKSCEPGMDVPIGIFRCVRSSNKCTGTIETVKNSNGRIHIKERDAHSCQ